MNIGGVKLNKYSFFMLVKEVRIINSTLCLLLGYVKDEDCTDTKTKKKITSIRKENDTVSIFLDFSSSDYFCIPDLEEIEPGKTYFIQHSLDVFHYVYSMSEV